MKKSNKYVSMLLATLLLGTSLAACGGGGDGGDIGLDEEGNVRPTGGGATTITFWGYGEQSEIDVFQQLVKNFNKEYEGVIKVNYETKSNSDFSTQCLTALGQSRASVDVLYVGDSDFKNFAERGFLEPLDSYLETSKEVVISDMWETSVNRFKYDVNTTTQNGPDAHYWGIPKDIGPTVIFYNETFFNNAGVKIISVAAEELEAFNNGAADSRGNTKASLGLAGTVKEKGYFIDDNGQKWFNNQVPMSWEECVTLSGVVQTSERAKRGTEKFWGYYTEWWFNYGWSVGGDCIEYVATDDPAYNGGYWDFTLMDATPNYIVADDNEDGFTVNGNTYQAGEIIEWADKLVDPAASNKQIRSEVVAAASEGKLNQLPSQRDAFVEFVRVGQTPDVTVDGNLKGYGICADPTSVGGDAGKAAAFASGQLAMLVDGRWNVTDFRESMGNNTANDKYVWDVAPLPQYKEYDEEGNITVHGVEAGHSGSVALCINAKSTKKNAAWKFAEYIGGATGQSAQAESGFAIPSQKSIAKSEVFLQSNQYPRNSIVFVRAAEYETPGDWWYLKDKLWIDPWAGVLNGIVREGDLTLSGFETNQYYLNTWATLKSYTKKK